MKTTLLFIGFFITLSTFSQTGGEVINDRRPIINDIDYEITGTKTGTLFFLISVNEEGRVISCNFDKNQSTIYSTPLMVKARNLITSGLKFEADSKYPEFHRGVVRITVVLPKSE